MVFKTINGRKVNLGKGFQENFERERDVKQTDQRNKIAVNKFLKMTKRKFPTMSGATVRVIADETGLMNHEVGIAISMLKKEGKVKQFKKFKGAVVST